MVTHVEEQRGHAAVNLAWQTTADDRGEVWSQGQGLTPVEHGGLVAAVVVFVAALFLLAVWADSRSGFERCATLTDVSARLACYEKVRQQELQPPAKGAIAPTALSQSGSRES
jgi:hypothetical protein